MNINMYLGEMSWACARHRKISCGEKHMGFICKNGAVAMIGDNTFGQLGVSKSLKDLSSQVHPFVKFQEKPDRRCVPTDMYYYPFNDEKLFDSSYSGTNAVEIACGGNHTLVLTKQGCVLSCGDNQYNQLGRSDVGIDEATWR